MKIPGNVVITGGAGGLGLAAAEYFAQKGARVFVCDIREAEFENKNIIYIPTDVSDEESVCKAAQTIAESAPHIDVLIHFAGIYMMDSYAEMSEERFKRILDINLLGVFRVNKAMLPLVQGGGRIIITTSELAPLDPLPFNGIYSLSKTALDCYAHSLRLELALLDIPVVVIRPGAFATDMVDASDTAMRELCERTRLYGANSRKFRRIMDTVTVRALPAQVLARLVFKAAAVRRPRPVYSKNASLLLKLYSAAPTRLQLFAIRLLLR